MREEWSPEERSNRAKKCGNPKGFTMRQFCKNIRTQSKSGEKPNRLKEVEMEDARSLAQQDYEDLLQTYSDVYKETHGIRPRGDLAMQFTSAQAVSKAIQGLYDYADKTRPAPSTQHWADTMEPGAEEYQELPKSTGMGRRMALEAFIRETLLNEQIKGRRRQINERGQEGEGILAWLDSAFKGFGVQFDDKMNDTSDYSLGAIQSSVDDNVASAAKDAGVTDVKDSADLNIKDDKNHRNIYFTSAKPAYLKILEQTSSALKVSKNVKSWTPPKDKAQRKKWSDENEDGLDKLYRSVGRIHGILDPLAEKGVQLAKQATVGFDQATKNPGNAVKYISRGCQNLKTIIVAEKNPKLNDVIKEIDTVAAITKELAQSISKDANKKM